ncbi:unnamed protein product [Caenorhabditis sp. 36 PRJEB53466]|nr:unnamed protein product [Caenorhabditis sp. 36 PRJEB53466]
MIAAFDQHDYAEVQRLLTEHPEEVSVRDEGGRVALHYAASCDDINTMKLVYVADKSLVDVADEEGLTPLFQSIQFGKIDHAEQLVKFGANLHHVDYAGRNLVHWAVVCGQLESLNWAIGKEVDVNLKDNTQSGSPLHYAVCTEDLPVETSQAILITLLRHGADPNALDTDKRTPILWCCSNGNLEAIIALHNSGGDLAAKDRDQLNTLHGAASHGFHEIVEFLVNRVSKSVINEVDNTGQTPLFYAVSLGHFEAARVLLQHGANPNFITPQLRTPAHHSASSGQLRMLKLLRQYGASFDIQNYRGDVPFHEAVQIGSKDMVEWLLAVDAKVVDAPNHVGRTPLHLAATQGNLEMVILLCTHKCQVDPLMIWKGKILTPLDFAIEQEHREVVDYLRMCAAKSAKEFTPAYISEWKRSFESMVVEAKRHRDQLMTEKKDRNRRPSTTDGVPEQEKKAKQIAEVGVNTSQRTSRSAEASKRKYSKSTSVTNLMEVPSAPKQELEALKASIESRQKEEEEDEGVVDILDLDDEFENLPPISDLSESSTSSSSRESESDDAKSEEEMERKITVKEVNATSSQNPKKVKKEVRIESEKKKKSPTNGTVLMRVRREPEIGSDGGDVDIYDDGDGHKSDDEEKGQSSPNVTNKKYIHERAIFQELTHLKRMQIQYGKVQEKVLVRSLISNFCKMHHLDIRNFKFTTFYAWERFLYDALSEQLKIIYLEERERLTENNLETKQQGGSLKLNKFDSRIRNSVPITDKFGEMQRVYSHSTISRRNKSGHNNGATASSRKRLTRPWY